MCDKEIEQKLLDSKVDKEMAQHISHLFIRDSISLFSERIHQDDVREMDHFEVRPAALLAHENSTLQRLTLEVDTYQLKEVRDAK